MKRGDREQFSDQSFFFLSLLLAVSISWFKMKNSFLHFYGENRVLIALVFSATVFAIYLKLRSILLKIITPQDLEEEILGESLEEDSVFAGISERKKRVYIKQSFRRMHTQVIGTTNAGKTESVILPWAIDDIRKGRGLLIVDGKSDRSLIDKLYAYASRYRRATDVRILSICEPGLSHTFNPLAGGTPLEVTERVFKAFAFESEYYKNLQYEALLQILLLLEKCNILPTPLRVIEALQSPVILKDLAAKTTSIANQRWVRDFLSLTREEREQRTSGLVTQFQPFSVGDMAPIFNAEKSDIDLTQALEQGLIIYCQLPALKVPTLGKAAGKLILQCLQSAVASRHLGFTQSKDFFSVYLDDFTEYLTESFVSLLNKSRSANVAIVFAHQALGDLAALGEGIKNTILTNANLKVFMRTNEPESAEYFSSVIGTSESLKVTERQRKGFFGTERTGDGSVRDVEEFKFHPNLFKQQLGVGEAIVVLPHAKGSLPVRLKFRKSPDLDIFPIPLVTKPEPKGLTKPESTVVEKRGGLDHLIQSNPETLKKEAA
jgi:type IV secretory pathway TraG/TraD family ATPase VirD4